MITKRVCLFCKEDKEPDYKDADSLRIFVSERGRIQGQARTGVCAKHQKGLTKAIKRARHLAMLPYVARV
jgi:small subunit ribosomal protein S18